MPCRACCALTQPPPTTSCLVPRASCLATPAPSGMGCMPLHYGDRSAHENSSDRVILTWTFCTHAPRRRGVHVLLRPGPLALSVEGPAGVQPGQVGAGPGPRLWRTTGWMTSGVPTASVALAGTEPTSRHAARSSAPFTTLDPLPFCRAVKVHAAPYGPYTSVVLTAAALRWRAQVQPRGGGQAAPLPMAALWRGAAHVPGLVVRAGEQPHSGEWMRR